MSFAISHRNVPILCRFPDTGRYRPKIYKYLTPVQDVFGVVGTHMILVITLSSL